jgi:hypothetical protein
MKVEYHVNKKYAHLTDELLAIPDTFTERGRLLKRGRNEIRVIEVGGLSLNVKSFKRPNVVNRVVYAWLRPSKALRSYHNAKVLTKAGIETPEAVAWIEYREWGCLTRSYYISLQVECDFEFRDLRVKRPPDMVEILKRFTRFTWEMHRCSIYFRDHSPGNTLIARKGGVYHFYLVDLNRMAFIRVSPRLGLRNFYRLNADEEMVRVIAGEYARLTGGDPGEMTRQLWEWTSLHDEQVRRRQARRAKVRGV